MCRRRASSRGPPAAGRGASFWDDHGRASRSLAASITGARYGALGVLGPAGTLTDFITTGITPEQRAAIGRLPVGKGILGVLIQEAHPLRLAEISKDPRSVGFPKNHPPMGSFLGAPVKARGRVYGNIYLTEKQGAAEFDEEDERALVVLATQAGVAIENARLYEEAHRRERRLDALREISGATLAGSGEHELLELMARRARELVDADVSAVVTASDDGDTLEITVADGAIAGELLGATFAAAGSIAGEVLRTRRPKHFPDLSADDQILRTMPGLGEIGPAMLVALGTHDRTFGALLIGNRKDGKPFGVEDLALIETFGAQAAVGLEYARSHSELQRLIVMEDRERIARELHDGAIQALFAVGMGLQGAATMAADEAMAARLEAAVGEIDRVIRDLRNYIFGLRPGILADRQLDQAIRTLVQEFQERNDVLAIAEIDPAAAAELSSRAGDVVQLVRELLSNVGRHSGAESCRITLSRQRDRVVLEVDDDGKGFDPASVRGGSGLPNLRGRTEALGGELTIESSRETGTTVRISLPA